MPKKWVLVVDDDSEILTVVSAALEHPALSVTTASDALQAFIQARDLKPIVIIADIQMPGFGDGSTILKRLREDPRIPRPPIVFMTGMDLVKAGELLPRNDPMIGLMPKPLDLNALRGYVWKLAGIAPLFLARGRNAMIIRKLYRFEAAHIVRNCSSDRCKHSIHGHSFRCELLLTADRLDRGQMVYDFGLLKNHVKDLLDGFDHATLFWEKESPEYSRAMKIHSKRWVSLPVSPTAEQLTRVIFVAAQALLDNTEKGNGDDTARVHSVILHETETGSAQCFREDAYNSSMGEVDLARVSFSDQVRSEWADPKMWEKMLKGARFKSVSPELQIPGEFPLKAPRPRGR